VARAAVSIDSPLRMRMYEARRLGEVAWYSTPICWARSKGMTRVGPGAHDM